MGIANQSPRKNLNIYFASPDSLCQGNGGERVSVCLVIEGGASTVKAIFRHLVNKKHLFCSQMERLHHSPRLLACLPAYVACQRNVRSPKKKMIFFSPAIFGVRRGREIYRNCASAILPRFFQGMPAMREQVTYPSMFNESGEEISPQKRCRNNYLF